ncbi:V-type proton ATPase subunit H [Vitis vinifera]|uniref:V-type proton ATPase subunit H n=1 Tax=Vitis vinifera TaxID=29760 RepID=A0A438BT45_VITVI|nr:V-type proton ATPase subunit H [Vitis vinifera]
MDRAELTTDQVLKRDIPWETYMTTKLITGTCLQLLRRYDNRSESQRAVLLDDDGPAYVRVFVSILRDIFKEETVEYVLALIDEMLTDCFGKVIGSYKRRALKKPSHPTRGIAIAISCLATLLKEPLVRSSFVQADGVKLLIPLISPASTQQSIQLLYETCLCVWLLSYYEPAIEYLATSRTLPRLVEVVRVVVLTLKNLLSKGAFGAQMDLMEALNQLDEGLKANIKKLSSFDKYKQEVSLAISTGPLFTKIPCSGVITLVTLKRMISSVLYMHNIDDMKHSMNRKILIVQLTSPNCAIDLPKATMVGFGTCGPQTLEPKSLIARFKGIWGLFRRVIVNDLKAKERVMKLMNHENAEVTKNSLLCIQRLFLGAKYASFLQA